MLYFISSITQLLPQDSEQLILSAVAMLFRTNHLEEFHLLPHSQVAISRPTDRILHKKIISKYRVYKTYKID